VPYLSTLEVCSRQGAIQIHAYLTLPHLTVILVRNRSDKDATITDYGDKQCIHHNSKVIWITFYW